MILLPAMVVTSVGIAPIATSPIFSTWSGTICGVSGIFFVRLNVIRPVARMTGFGS